MNLDMTAISSICNIHGGQLGLLGEMKNAEACERSLSEADIQSFQRFLAYGLLVKVIMDGLVDLEATQLTVGDPYAKPICRIPNIDERN